MVKNRVAKPCRRGQAGAADLLVFALLITIGIVILNIGPLSYQTSQQLKAFEDRYHHDYVDSSLLTMKYVIVGRETAGGGEIVYTIGPFGAEAEGFVAEVADLLKEVGFQDLPIRRRVKGTVLDWMADDVVINLEYFGLKLSRPLVARSYSEQCEKVVTETLDALFGDKYYYFVVVEYTPSKEIDFIRENIYGVVTYTNYGPLKGLGGSPEEIRATVDEKLLAVPNVRVTDMPIIVSNNPDFVISLLEFARWQLEDMMGETVKTLQNLLEAGAQEAGQLRSLAEKVEELRDVIETGFTPNTHADVRLYVWPKA